MSQFTNTTINTGAFFLISLPATYKFISEIIGNILPGNIGKYISGLKECSGPTHFAQTIIFTVIIFAIVILLNIFAINNKKNIWYYVKYAFYSGLLYYFVSNIGTYEIISNIAGQNMLDENGCPTITGLILHSILFFVLHLFLIR